MADRTFNELTVQQKWRAKEGWYPAMRLQGYRRKTLSTLVVAGTAAAVVALGGSPARADLVLWNGFGWGGTAEVALDNAIDDAINSASWQGPVECQLYGEPVIWERFNEQTGSHWFEASVDMTYE